MENVYLEDYRDSYEAVKQSDFILPEEVEKALNFKYSKEAINHFLKTVPSQRDIGWYKENDFIFIPGPPEIFSMEKIVSIEPSLFLFEENDDDTIKTTCNRYHFSLETGWVLIKKKNLIIQKTYLELDNEVWPKNVYGEKYSCPSPAALAWAMLVYNRTRNISLFKGLKVMTSPLIPFKNGYGTRIVFAWNDSNKIEISKTKRPDTPIDATCIIESVPLIALTEEDLPF